MNGVKGWGMWLALVFIVLSMGPARAVDPAEKLADPQAEARAEELGKGLRCLVCQSESIEESNADLARDLRVIVRERVTAGDSDKQIIDYVVSRYGDYVLLNPPFKASTLVLWLGPLVILLLAVGMAVPVFRRRSAEQAEEELSEAEQAHLKALMKKDKQ